MVPSSLFHEQIVIVFHDGRHKAAQFFGNGVVARFEGRRPNLSVEPHLTASALFIDHDKALIVAIHKVRFIRKQSQFIQVRRTAPGAEGPAVAAFVAQGIEVENLRCRWPGTSMATLARLGQTSVQTSQMLSQWRQRPSQPSAGGAVKKPRWS